MTSFNSRKIVFRTLVLVAGICFWNALPERVSRDASDGLVASATAEVSSSSHSVPAVRTQPIETVRVGQRVLARNPEVTEQERSSWGEEPDFSQWVYLKLQMPKEDGSTLKIDLLRPPEWVDSQLNYIVSSRESPEASQPTAAAGLSLEQDAEQYDSTPSTRVASVARNRSSIGTGARSEVSISESTTPGLRPQVASNLGDPGEEPDVGAEESDPQQLVPLSPLRPVFFNLAMASAQIEASGAELVGLTVDMDLPEMGASGTAIVVDILPAPQIEPRGSNTDDRQVLTATFRHPPSTTVLDVTFAEDEPPYATGLKPETQNPNPVGSADLGVTDNHLFWSVDRQEFAPIGEMEIGERVQTYQGETKRIASKFPRPGPPAEVYNLEVYGEHVYFVGFDLFLAHNSCDFDQLHEIADQISVMKISQAKKHLSGLVEAGAITARDAVKISAVSVGNKLAARARKAIRDNPDPYHYVDRHRSSIDRET